MIQDEYFSNNKNFSNYILERANNNNLDEISNTNVTINCKNYDPFFYPVNGKNSKIFPISNLNSQYKKKNLD